MSPVTKTPLIIGLLASLSLQLALAQAQADPPINAPTAAAASATAPDPAALTAFEATQDQILMQAGAPLARLYSELSALDNNKNRSAAEESRRQSLKVQLTQAGKAFQQTFEQVLTTLNTVRRDKGEDIKDARALQDTLRELGQRLGEPVVALYTVVAPESYSLILTTAEYQRVYTVPIKAAALNEQIAAWRNTLKSQTLDPVPQARALLDVILPPAARTELQQANAGTLMWHLDGALRLLPLAALHDGEKYLVQRYRLTTFTPASLGHLKDAPKARWNALGLGVSEARTVAQRSFIALPSVAHELDTVVRQKGGQGVMPGTRLLNSEFTWITVQNELQHKGKYQLIHIASHCNLEPGNDAMGYLLTGAGEPITLAQLVRQNNLFGGVDLLTLSACETGVGAGQDSTGREVDGLSFIAQRQGAKSVMVTLWPVADASTALLMQRFYQLRESGNLTKAEALRQAQVSLLQGARVQAQAPAITKEAPDERGAQRLPAPGGTSAAAFAANPDAPFAHPYFWAPFILMGNWL